LHGAKVGSIMANANRVPDHGLRSHTTRDKMEPGVNPLDQGSDTPVRRFHVFRPELEVAQA
jgi:hypothetical protein